MNDAPVARHIIGHCNAFDTPAGPIFVLTPIATMSDAVARMAQMSEPPETSGMRLMGPTECVAGVVRLLDQAAVLDPGIFAREYAEIVDIIAMLSPAVIRMLQRLAREKTPNPLTRFLDQEAGWRVEERLIGAREAARQRGLGDAQALIRALLAIAAEPDVTARAAALAALAPELRRVLPDEGRLYFHQPAR